MADFFISHSSKDYDKIIPIVDALESLGYSCWIAPRDVVGRYAKAIVEAIQQTKVFLLFLTENSATSEQVLNEVETAFLRKRQDGISITPVTFGTIPMEDSVYDEIMYYIRRINFFTIDELAEAGETASKIGDYHKEILGKVEKEKERTKSSYYASERETNRLEKQDLLTFKVDEPLWKQILSEVECKNVLDVGCGNGRVIAKRMALLPGEYRIIGLDSDEHKIADANQRFGAEGHVFETVDVESADFDNELTSLMDREGIQGFDIINIAMLLLHLKAPDRLLRVLRRKLSPNGVLIIRDIDDGLNFSYPDPDHICERLYEICDAAKTSGFRRTGRQIPTWLIRAGYRDVAIVSQGLSTTGLSVDEKEDFFSMYFGFVLGDIEVTYRQNPDDNKAKENYLWSKKISEELFEQFMAYDSVTSLGLVVVTARR